MRKNKKRDIVVCISLIVFSIIYTILVKTVDVKMIGPLGSYVGFAKINNFIFQFIGTNMFWYKVTDWFGLIPIAIAFIYIIIGFIQLLKRRSILKVDKEILTTGFFYLIVIFIYIFFERNVINYRPVLIDSVLEASYPSSHTLISICICGSSLILNKRKFNNSKFAKFENVISIFAIIVIVVGRIISGVHWFTDIVGAFLISISLLKLFSLFLRDL